MNLYGAIILTALLFDYVLNLIAGLLNLTTVSHELPGEFAANIDLKSYERSRSYTRIRTKFGFVESTFSLVIVLLFWFGGGFNLLDELVRRWQFGTIVTGVLYIGILLLVRATLSIPLNVYSTFVIEERFGFNKTTPKTFVIDYFKGLLLAFVLGIPLLLGMLAFFEYAGVFAWLYCWITATVFILIVQFVAPTFIMPLFNKFTPLEPGELKNEIISYAMSVRFSLSDVFVMDGSKRSNKSNAFFTGFGKNKRVVLFDTLIQKHTVGELVAILAHEIGHYKKKHIQHGIVINIIHTGVMFFLMSLFIGQRGLFEAFYMQNVTVYAGLLFFGLLFTPIEFFLSLGMNALSRKNEFEADRFSVETFKKPETMIIALKKLSLDNLSHLTPHPFYVKLNYSHPPIVQRIQAIRCCNK